MSSSSNPIGTMPKFTSVKLGQSNYPLWSWEFRLAAKAAEIWNIIDGDTMPTVTTGTDSIAAVTQDHVDAWKRLEAIAKNQIAKCVDDEMKVKIFSKSTAAEMWSCLAGYHQGKSRRERYRKKQDLHFLKFRDYKNMASFLDAILLKTDELKQMGSEMDEDDIIIAILDKIPAEYSHAASYIRNPNSNDGYSLQEVVQYLNDESQNVERKQSATQPRNESHFPPHSLPGMGTSTSLEEMTPSTNASPRKGVRGASTAISSNTSPATAAVRGATPTTLPCMQPLS